MRILQYILQPQEGKSRMYKGRGHPPTQGTIYMVYIGADGEDLDDPEEWVVTHVYRELWKGPDPVQVHHAAPLSVMDEVHESASIVIRLQPKEYPPATQGKVMGKTPQRIESRDTRKIVEALTHQLGVNHWHEEWSAPKHFNDHYRTEDGWDVLIGGWHHREGWCRGYMVSDRRAVGVDVKPRGHVSPQHDGGRYGGRGWRDRMVDDIVQDIERLRAGK